MSEGARKTIQGLAHQLTRIVSEEKLEPSY